MKKLIIILLIISTFLGCLKDDILLVATKPNLDVNQRISISNHIDFSFVPKDKSVIDTVYLKNNIEFNLKLIGYELPDNIELLNKIDKVILEKNDSIPLILKFSPTSDDISFKDEVLSIKNNFEIPLEIKLSGTSIFNESLNRIKVDSLDLNTCYLGSKSDGSIRVVNGYKFNVDINEVDVPQGFEITQTNFTLKANSVARIPISFKPEVKKTYREVVKFSTRYGGNLSAIVKGAGLENIFRYVNTTEILQTIHIGASEDNVAYKISGSTTSSEFLRITQFYGFEIANLKDLEIKLNPNDTISIYNAGAIASISNLKYTANIPEDLFDNCMNLKSLNSVFEGSSINQIPPKIFKNLLKLESIQNGFKSCTNIAQIPDMLFENNVNIKSFKQCFVETSVSTISDNIFPKDWNEKEVSNNSVFEDLFEEGKKINIVVNKQNISDVNSSILQSNYFRNICSSSAKNRIILGGSNYFYNSKEWILEQKFTFINNSSINQVINIGADSSEIEYEIYNGQIKKGNLKLAEIDETGNVLNLDQLAIFLYAGDTLVINSAQNIVSISNLHISSSQTISSDLFQNCVNVISFYSLFKNSEFSSIPQDLFKYNTKVVNFESAFEKCLNIKKLPINLFKYNKKVFNFKRVFAQVNLTFAIEKIFSDTFKASEGNFYNEDNVYVILDDFIISNNPVFVKLEADTNDLNQCTSIIKESIYFKTLLNGSTGFIMLDDITTSEIGDSYWRWDGNKWETTNPNE